MKAVIDTINQREQNNAKRNEINQSKAKYESERNRIKTGDQSSWRRTRFWSEQSMDGADRRDYADRRTTTTTTTANIADYCVYIYHCLSHFQ